ncbi:hypothetical protein EDD18DRAFT_1100519 [Armillaria luteobubalina]|uniref:F-box domain-containing protein n=1 Tax=Armillaria luteobubalina TaxID=153913 RepID=A0AA39QFK8_9AGAR|nr:hypothetical protein EDD18DRAFT_1100519 [Armillaria luteobubalina]
MIAGYLAVCMQAKSRPYGYDAPEGASPYYTLKEGHTTVHMQQHAPGHSREFLQDIGEADLLARLFQDVMLYVNEHICKFLPEIYKDLTMFVNHLPPNDHSLAYPFSGFVINVGVAMDGHQDSFDKLPWDILIFPTGRITHFNLHFDGLRGSVVLHSDKGGGNRRVTSYFMLLQLPVELLLKISELLNRESQKNLRLVCKSLNDATIELVFVNFNITVTEDALLSDRAMLKRYVKVLHLIQSPRLVPPFANEKMPKKSIKVISSGLYRAIVSLENIATVDWFSVKPVDDTIIGAVFSSICRLPSLRTFILYMANKMHRQLPRFHLKNLTSLDLSFTSATWSTVRRLCVKRTSASEEKYKAYLLVLAALKFALEKFSDIVYGFPVEVETDCFALRDSIFNIVDVRHIPGSTNLVCDALSRKGTDKPRTVTDGSTENVSPDWFSSSGLMFDIYSAGVTPDDASEVAEGLLVRFKDTSTYYKIVEALELLAQAPTNEREAHRAARRAAEYIIEYGRLWHVGGGNPRRARPRVECLNAEEMRLKATAQHVDGGHQRRDAMKVALMDKYQSPGLDRIINRVIMECGSCKAFRGMHLHSLLEPDGNDTPVSLA